jgi:hypothetical protein
MGDLRLGLRPSRSLGALARAGFTDLHHEVAADRYRVATPAGEPAEFPMFLVRGQKPLATAPVLPRSSRNPRKSDDRYQHPEDEEQVRWQARRQAATKVLGPNDFKVRNLADAEFGRKEIELAEVEMPGLMAIRDEYKSKKQPLKGARITGSLHMTIQTAVLIETLVELGAEVRWCLVQHLQHAGPRRGGDRGRPEGHRREAEGVPVFAWKGETLEEYWWCTEQALTWPDGRART